MNPLHLFIFTNVIRCSRLPKETNWLINKKEMWVLLLDVFKHLLTFSKLAGKVNFSERKFEEMH